MTTFSKGDRVRFNQDYDFPIKKGDEGTVAIPAVSGDLLSVKMDKSGQTHYVYGYRLDKIEPKKFKVGDRVIDAKNWYYAEHQDKPLVVLDASRVGSYGVGLVGNDASLKHSSKGWYAYPEQYLELYAPTFAVGDYVEVWGFDPNSSWEGKKGEVTEVGYYVHIKPEDGGITGGFFAKQLRKAVRPAPKRLTALEKSGFKVGDRVQVVVPDGDTVGVAVTYEGQKGTVSTGSAACYIPVTLDGGKELLFETNELEAYAPTLLEKHGLKVGDKVRAKGYQSCLSTQFNNNGGTIAESKSAKFLRIALESGNYNDALPEEIELVPEVVFNVGDWVEVVDYGSYEGTQGEVIRNSNWGGRKCIKTEAGSELHFQPANLKLVKRPVVVFAVGDWVEVHGRGDQWDGTQGEITAMPKKDDWYQFVMIKDVKGDSLHFQLKKLKKAERPVVKTTILDEAGVKIGDKVYWSGVNDKLHTKFRENGATVTGHSPSNSFVKVDAEGTPLHLLPAEITLEKPKSWAEKAEIGDTFVTKDSKGKVSRFLVKLGNDNWTRQYPNTTSLHSDLSNEAVEFYADEKYYQLTKV